MSHPVSSQLTTMEPSTFVAVAIVAFALYQLFRGFRTYWRLRHIPGPFLAAWSNIPRVSWVMTGHAHLIHQSLHDTYGPLVRIGPETVSADDPESIPTIYTTKPGFVKVGLVVTTVHNRHTLLGKG